MCVGDHEHHLRAKHALKVTYCIEVTNVTYLGRVQQHAHSVVVGVVDEQVIGQVEPLGCASRHSCE